MIDASLSDGSPQSPRETLAEAIALYPIEKLRRHYQFALEDSVDDETQVMALAARVLPAGFADGDSYHYVGVIEVAEMLVAEIERLRVVLAEQK